MIHGVVGTIKQIHHVLNFNGFSEEVYLGRGDFEIKGQNAVFRGDEYLVGFDGWCTYRGMRQCYEFHQLDGQWFNLPHRHDKLVKNILGITCEFGGRRYLIVPDWMAPVPKIESAYPIPFPESMEWQPIETAPVGRYVLGGWFNEPDSSCPFVCMTTIQFENCPYADKWKGVTGRPFTSPPTIWRDLPEPPDVPQAKSQDPDPTLQQRVREGNQAGS